MWKYLGNKRTHILTFRNATLHKSSLQEISGQCVLLGGQIGLLHSEHRPQDLKGKFCTSEAVRELSIIFVD
jgi:hypothetical protein